jgi:hypothetical protein
MFEGAARLRHLPRCGPVSCFATGVEEGATGRRPRPSAGGNTGGLEPVDPPLSQGFSRVERVTGIEPALSAWEW